MGANYTSPPQADYNDMILYGEIYAVVMKAISGDLTAAKSELGQSIAGAIMGMPGLPAWAEFSVDKQRRKKRES